MRNIVYLFLMLSLGATAQQRLQFFDGADTLPSNSVIFNMDSSHNTTWQIGPPSKHFFDSASTRPNALITDTIHHYKSNDSSYVSFPLRHNFLGFGIAALQWNQKIDFEDGVDFGLIEYSVDTGRSWRNVIGSPYTYNFFGYHPSNIDTMPNGELAFTGTDSIWRNVWMCYDLSWVWILDTIEFRFKILSDSLNNHEGWMIDNFYVAPTFVHTIKEKEQKEYIELSPNPTAQKITINLENTGEFHIIKNLKLVDLKGSTIQSWQNCPDKFFINMDPYPEGVYFLDIETNIKREVKKFIYKK